MNKDKVAIKYESWITEAMAIKPHNLSEEALVFIVIAKCGVSKPKYFDKFNFKIIFFRWANIVNPL